MPTPWPLVVIFCPGVSSLSPMQTLTAVPLPGCQAPRLPEASSLHWLAPQGCTQHNPHWKPWLALLLSPGSSVFDLTDGTAGRFVAHAVATAKDLQLPFNQLVIPRVWDGDLASPSHLEDR